MRNLFSLLFLSVLLLSSPIIQSQQMKTFSSKEAQMLPEIKGVIIVENGKLVVGPLPSADQRDKEYKDVDLKSGDEIQFVNGKRVKTMDDFKKKYSEIKVGDELKLGVKREEQRFIVAFKKSQEVKGNVKIMTVTSDGKGGDRKFKVEGGKVMVDGKKINVDSLKKSGSNIIIKKDKKD